MNPRAYPTFVAIIFLGAAACTPAMLAAFGVIAPVATSALDAYTATAKAIAPAASQPDLAVLAELLRRRDECVVAVSATMPDAGAAPADGEEITAALLASSKATADLAAAVDRMAPKKRKHKHADGGADAGTEGGS